MIDAELRNISILLMIIVLLLKITIGLSDFFLISGVIISLLLRLMSMPIIRSYINRFKLSIKNKK